MLNTYFKKLTVASLLTLSSVAYAAEIDMNADVNDLAIKGYDPVSYFSGGQPIAGNVKYTATYKGAIYHFSNEENRDKFKTTPATYAPQYGGFCAFGVAMGKKFDTDPLAWKIVDNKLYLNLNKKVQKKWLTDVPGYLSQSNENWSSIKSVEANAL